MATILFAQELGMGFGHLNRLLSIAGHFRAHDLVFGVPDARRAGPLVATKLGPSTRVMDVGEWRYAPSAASRLPEGSPWTLADMLYDFGFGERGWVAAGVSKWTSRLDAVRPDLIVADFAPMLRIAAANRVPTVVVGNGYTVPPSMSPLPGLRPHQRAPSSASCARERAVLTSVNEVRERSALASFRRVADFFQGDDTFPATFAIFDPYKGLRARPPLPAYNIPSICVGPAHDERSGAHVFCYLDPGYPGLNPLLTALNGLARPSQIFIRDLDPRDIVRHCAPQVAIHQGQADFGAILPQTRLLIHHGNLGTAAAGALAGVPQFLLPFTLEQELTSSNLAEHDCAVSLVVEATADPKNLRASIETLLMSRRAQTAALTLARLMQASRTFMPEMAIVAACRSHLEHHAVR